MRDYLAGFAFGATLIGTVFGGGMAVAQPSTLDTAYTAKMTAVAERVNTAEGRGNFRPTARLDASRVTVAPAHQGPAVTTVVTP